MSHPLVLWQADHFELEGALPTTPTPTRGFYRHFEAHGGLAFDGAYHDWGYPLNGTIDASGEDIVGGVGWISAAAAPADAPNRIYAWSQYAAWGLYVSDDHGATWTPRAYPPNPGSVPFSTGFDCLQSGRLYIVTDGDTDLVDRSDGIWRSLNDAASWTRFLPMDGVETYHPDGSADQLYPICRGTLALGSAVVWYGYLRTGEFWQPTHPSYEDVKWTFEVGYAPLSGGAPTAVWQPLFRDGGSSPAGMALRVWSDSLVLVACSGLKIPSSFGGPYDYSSSMGCWKINAGIVTKITPPDLLTPGQEGVWDVLPLSATTYIVLKEGPLIENPYVPDDVMLRTSLIYRTTDAGATWSLVKTLVGSEGPCEGGAAPDTGYWLLGRPSDGTHEVWLAGGVGLYSPEFGLADEGFVNPERTRPLTSWFSNDDGATWTAFEDPNTPVAVPPAHSTDATAGYYMIPNAGGLIGSSMPTAPAPVATRGFYRHFENEGGLVWDGTFINFGYPLGGDEDAGHEDVPGGIGWISSAASPPDAPNRIYAWAIGDSATTGLYISDNHGATWTAASSYPSSVGNGDPFSTCLTCPRSGHLYMVTLSDATLTGRADGIWASTNDAVSWTRILAMEGTQTFHPVSGGSVIYPMCHGSVATAPSQSRVPSVAWYAYMHNGEQWEVGNPSFVNSTWTYELGYVPLAGGTRTIVWTPTFSPERPESLALRPWSDTFALACNSSQSVGAGGIWRIDAASSTATSITPPHLMFPSDEQVWDVLPLSATTYVALVRGGWVDNPYDPTSYSLRTSLIYRTTDAGATWTLVKTLLGSEGPCQDGSPPEYGYWLLGRPPIDDSPELWLAGGVGSYTPAQGLIDDGFVDPERTRPLTQWVSVDAGLTWTEVVDGNTPVGNDGYYMVRSPGGLIGSNIVVGT